MWQSLKVESMGGHEGRALINEISVLIKETREHSCPSLHERTKILASSEPGIRSPSDI